MSHRPNAYQSILKTVAVDTEKNRDLCNTTYMIKTQPMTDFPTDFELKQLEAEIDDTLTLDCDEWVDAMMQEIADLIFD